MVLKTMCYNKTILKKIKKIYENIGTLDFFMLKNHKHLLFNKCLLLNESPQKLKDLT